MGVKQSANFALDSKGWDQVKKSFSLRVPLNRDLAWLLNISAMILVSMLLIFLSPIFFSVFDLNWQFDTGSVCMPLFYSYIDDFFLSLFLSWFHPYGFHLYGANYFSKTRTGSFLFPAFLLFVPSLDGLDPFPYSSLFPLTSVHVHNWLPPSPSLFLLPPPRSSFLLLIPFFLLSISYTFLLPSPILHSPTPLSLCLLHPQI